MGWINDVTSSTGFSRVLCVSGGFEPAAWAVGAYAARPETLVIQYW
ncbi:protein of unknown function [Candidatus Promineifilum breve]|uniref:Uncharacterized protein n=1 Tax=Candidatus Promineifilum breve TaxID=1806508 RepID=A0A160T0I3_9CHLR|nr:protein of unknown function [Candidatus Promineifilum breve]